MLNHTLLGRATGLACFVGITLPGFAANVSITSSSFTYSQAFDSLATSGSANTWTSGSTIAAWYASGSFSGNYTASDGSSATGDLYSFGTGTASDRALGSIATSAIRYGVQFRNNTGAALTTIYVQYYGEQWRDDDTGDQTLTFATRVSATELTGLTGTYVTQSALSFTSPQSASSGGTALDGNAFANRTLKIASFSLAVPVGSYFMLRWSDAADAAGVSHGLGIDDLFVSVPEAGTWGGVLAGLGALGWTLSRQRRR